MDLTTLHPNARGFRRAFVGYPYVYLAPGEFNIAARIDMTNLGISGVSLLDLGAGDRTLGGYQGGFHDNGWACFNPFRTYYGPVGGLRSTLPADKGHTRSYYSSIILCVSAKAWTYDAVKRPYTKFQGTQTRAIAPYMAASPPDLYTIDISSVQPALRGFSDAIRYGRYAYFAPYAYVTHSYVPYLVRVYLGTDNIYKQISGLLAGGGRLRDIVDIMDLSQVNPFLSGFSSLFPYGEYIILVPFRNSFSPQNGQRGHGNFVRVDLNQFSLGSTLFLDCATSLRAQIPSAPDDDLIGFSFGFPSGQYGLFVPFYNGIFSGKIARVGVTNLPYDPTAQAFDPTIGSDKRAIGELQELDLTNTPPVDHPIYANIFKGFRGGFINLWYGSQY